MAAVPQDPSRKLPIALQDVSQWMQVPLETWSALLTATGEGDRLTGHALSHEFLLTSLAANSPNDATFDVIETIFELGSEDGRNRVLQAAEDQGVDLATTDDEATPELVARLCLKSLTHESAAKVLMLALISMREAAHPRRRREFAGPRALSAQDLTREGLRQVVAAWCKENGKSEAVEILTFQRDGHWHCEILRGDALKRVPEIRDNRIGMLTFRPVASDHVDYDPHTGRLSVSTRSPHLCKAYQALFGSLIAKDSGFFAGEALYTLKPLQVRGESVFDAVRPSEVLRVDVVELRARLNDRDDIFVRGQDCFRVLREFGANLQTGELTEARLKVHLAGQRRPGRVSIKVPNQLEIKASGREDIIERMLSDIGVIGSYDEEGQPTTFWSQFPWRMHESDWRPRLGAQFDRLYNEGFFQPVVLGTVRDLASPSGKGYLQVQATDADSYVGSSDDPHAAPRTLTLTDVQGFQLDLQKVTRQIQNALGLTGPIVELQDGVWSLGSRGVGTHDLKVLIATRKPTRAAAKLVVAQSGKERLVLLMPWDCEASIAVPQVRCRMPTGPYDPLFGDVLRALGLEDAVSLSEYRTEDFLLDDRAGLAWYRSVRLTELAADSHPFKFAREVAKAAGELVSNDHLAKQLSPASLDLQVVKKAKHNFTKSVEASFKKAGKTCPPEAKNLFEPRSSRGYLLRGSAYVRI